MDTFGFQPQYFADKGFGNVLNGLEQRVVSGLQQAAIVVDEYPTQTPPPAATKDVQNTIAFWRLFDLQKRKQSLQETKEALQQTDSHTADRRLQIAEDAFLDLAELLTSAPDPAALLASVGPLHASIDALRQQNQSIASEVQSAQSDNKLLEASVRVQQLQAQNASLQEQLTQEAQAKAQLESASQEAEQHKQQAKAVQADLQRLQAELQRVQVENERSQNKLFELMSKEDEQESARQQDADQAAADLEEAHKKLRSLKQERDYLQSQLEAPQEHGTGSGASTAAAENLQALQSQLAAARTEMQEAHVLSSEQESKLQTSLQTLQEQVAALQDELAARPEPQELTRLKERVVMLQALVDSPEEAEAGDVAAAEKAISATGPPLHRILQERNRKLNADVTKLKNVVSEQEGEIGKLDQDLKKLRQHEEQQKGLIAQLESDLLQSSATVAHSTAHNTTASPEEADQSGSVTDAQPDKATQPKLLDIVTSQRDRFRVRVAQLEQEVGTASSQLQQAQSQLAAMEGDNVGLLEKIRYLQRYSSSQRQTSSGQQLDAVQLDGAGVPQPQAQQAHRMSCGPFSLNYAGADAAPSGIRSRPRRRAACFGGGEEEYDVEAASKGELERKYTSAYEARLNPFVEFQQHENETRMNKLNLHDRALLSGSRLVLGSKAMRFFVAIYAVLLHAVIFVLVYYSALSPVLT